MGHADMSRVQETNEGGRAARISDLWLLCCRSELGNGYERGIDNLSLLSGNKNLNTEMLWLDIVCFIRQRMFHFVKMAAAYSVYTQFCL